MSVRWIGRVWESSPYQGDRLLLHLALADYANEEGECWPSQRTLARKARCSERWVREAIGGMIADGWVEIVEQTIGRGGRTLYRLKAEATSSLEDKRGTPEQVKRNSDASAPLINRQEPSLSVTDFDAFWQAYPRKVAKGAAQRAWTMLSRRADAPPIGEILSAVKRYTSATTDPRYLCHPATWIRAERWSDEIAAATQPQTPAQPSRFRNAETFAAGLRASGRTRAEVEEALQGRPPEEIAAGLAIFDHR